MLRDRSLLALVVLAAALGGAACGTPASAPAPREAGAKLAKRMGPAAVPPVRRGALEFRVVHWGFERGLAQNGGYIAAHDATSGRELWLLRVYEVRYDPRRERDVQDRFIAELHVQADGRLLVVDEEGGRYEVDPVSRTVRPL